MQRIVLLDRREAERLDDLAREAKLSVSAYLRFLVRRHLERKWR